MCVAHEHGGDKSGIRKTRKLADTSYHDKRMNE